MSVEVSLSSPLAEALNSVIEPKLIEIGWASDGLDQSALSEYIVLMLVNGKTQEQIAAELSGDLLNLGPNDPVAAEFSRWLFEQVEVISRQLSGTSATINQIATTTILPQDGADVQGSSGDSPDTLMGDAGDTPQNPVM
jgi:hypothetical protein